MNDDEDEKNDDDYKVNNGKTTTSKSFEYKTKIIGSTLVNTDAFDSYWRISYTAATSTSSALFKITSTKICISVVTLAINKNIKFLENLKQWFKISLNKYGSGITTKPKNNNLDYVINPAFINTNSLFVASFKNGDNDLKRQFFEKCYTLLV